MLPDFTQDNQAPAEPAAIPQVDRFCKPEEVFPGSAGWSGKEESQ
jgi:hypothetical protein